MLWSLGAPLPIYFEDSHAGSFGFFAETLDLEKSYTLLLIDAHSDASGIAGSDAIRSGLRKVRSLSERTERIRTWRNTGTIQPFNWIEPLMPAPIEQVLWVAADKLLDDSEKAALQSEAAIQLDWQAEFTDRQCGELGQRYRVIDWTEFAQFKPEGAVIVSIDLDYFTLLENPIECLEEMWQKLLLIPRLEAVSFCLSRPWQTSEELSKLLFFAAFQCALSVKNANLFYEPFLTDLHDRSEKAKSYYKKGELPPRFDISQSSERFKSLFLQNKHRVTVKHNPEKWQQLLAGWKNQIGADQLTFRNAQQSLDGVWRLKTDELDDVWIQLDSPQGNRPSKVTWWLLEPEYSSYNIIPSSGLGKGFTGEAMAYITMKKRLLCETDDLALSYEKWSSELKQSHGLGVVRIQAELSSEKGPRFTNVMEIRVRDQDGFLGSLEEQFGSPYVFGIGAMKSGNASGPETLVGNDCANFLVYAWRRQGIALPWCNPKQLKSHLKRTDNSTVTRNDIEEGIVIHLGSHVCALWEDRGKIGTVDSGDLVAHHLGGFPELITIGALAKGRDYEVFRVAKPDASISLAIGGDICLAGQMTEPYLSDKMIKHLDAADLAVANLECVLTDHHAERKDKRFSYLASPAKAGILKHFDLLSLANNHSGDGGEQGCADTMKWLNSNNILTTGAGTLDQACTVQIVNIKDLKVGFVAFNTIETDFFSSSLNNLGLATYPDHKKEIEQSIREADVDYIVALPHWGDEYTLKINSQQRDIARWLISSGVDLIVGSHTHTVQEVEFHQGKCVIYSLGNLIFEKQNPAGFNDRVLALIDLSHTPHGAKRTSLRIASFTK